MWRQLAVGWSAAWAALLAEPCPVGPATSKLHQNDHRRHWQIAGWSHEAAPLRLSGRGVFRDLGGDLARSPQAKANALIPSVAVRAREVVFGCAMRDGGEVSTTLAAKASDPAAAADLAHAVDG